MLLLGGVIFEEWEIPAKIDFGIRQKHSIHRLAGATKIIDATGPDDKPIKWSGRLQGENAIERKNMIEAMVAEGSEQPLFFDGVAKTVLPVDAHFEFEAPYQILYTIEIEPISDPGRDAVANVGIVSIGDLVAAAIGEIGALL